MKQFNKIRNQRKERYINRIKNMSIKERTEFINKCINKYSSDEYIKRELSIGYYEPRCQLYDVLIDYGVAYGMPSEYNINDCLPEEQYDIDGNFIVGSINGQGGFIYVNRIPKNTIIPHIFEEYPLSVYDNNDNKICSTTNESTFIDILIQLREKNLTGYYVKYKNKRFDIDPTHYKIINKDFTFGKIHSDLLIKFTLKKD